MLRKSDLIVRGYERHRHIMAAIRTEGVSNWVFRVMFGELAIMLWLIIMGAKETRTHPLATAA